jgi:long-chain acyl-CoA synthetase
MLYSSGTTGRPKGVKPALSGGPIDAPHALQMMAMGLFGFSGDSLYLSPAPLYHAAPLRWCMTVHKMGGTVIVMEKFDPEAALALIEKYKVSCGQFVPTHFVRMLKLPRRGPRQVRRRRRSSRRSTPPPPAPCRSRSR